MITTIQVPICDVCKTQIPTPNGGFIIHGNIYVAEIDQDGKPGGGLIENNFPIENVLIPRPPDNGPGVLVTYSIDLQVFQDNVGVTCLCIHCFLRALGLTKKVQVTSR